MAPLAVTPGALAKVADGSLADGQRCTLQVSCSCLLLPFSAPHPHPNLPAVHACTCLLVR